MPTVITINGQTQRCDAEAITVGRGPQNTVSLPNDERLAPLHAELRSVAGRWIVEAKGGCPIRVGAGRPTQFAWINPGDVIYLTDTGPELVFEPGRNTAGPAPTSQVAPPVSPYPTSVAPASVPAPVSASAAVIRQPYAAQASATVAEDVNGLAKARPHGNWTLSVTVAGVVAFSLIGLGIILGGRGRSTPDGVNNDRKKDRVASESAGSSTESAIQAKGASSATVDAHAAADPKRSLFLIELKAADDARSVQLGTAWAVGPRRLVTTGDVARQIELCRESYPVAVARHSVTRDVIEITATALHPQFETARNRLEPAERELRRLKFEREQTSNPEDRSKIEAVLRRLDTEVIIAADDAINFNVGLLDVARDLPAASLTWHQAQSSSAKIGQKFRLVGHPLPTRNMLVDPDHPIPPTQHEGQLQHTATAPDGQEPPHWLLSFDDALREQNWSGSPVLDENGIVVGMYSRPTPALGTASAGALVTHDITVIESLRTLMRGNK